MERRGWPSSSEASGDLTSSSNATSPDPAAPAASSAKSAQGLQEPAATESSTRSPSSGGSTVMRTQARLPGEYL
ncbi:MAG: hypothetical protein RXR47_03010 [Nitrososphaeria archaeon]